MHAAKSAHSLRYLRLNMPMIYMETDIWYRLHSLLWSQRKSTYSTYGCWPAIVEIQEEHDQRWVSHPTFLIVLFFLSLRSNVIRSGNCNRIFNLEPSLFQQEMTNICATIANQIKRAANNVAKSGVAKQSSKINRTHIKHVTEQPHTNARAHTPTHRRTHTYTHTHTRLYAPALPPFVFPSQPPPSARFNKVNTLENAV